MYYAMERMDISLIDYQEKGNRLNKKQQDILFKKLQQLHKLNIIHDDFFSRNILLKYLPNDDIEPYISDFGLSKTEKDLFNLKKQQDIRDFNRLVEVAADLERRFAVGIIVLYEIPIEIY